MPKEELCAEHRAEIERLRAALEQVYTLAEEAGQQTPQIQAIRRLISDLFYESAVLGSE